LNSDTNLQKKAERCLEINTQDTFVFETEKATTGICDGFIAKKILNLWI